jgi:hypothetical protein
LYTAGKLYHKDLRQIWIDSEKYPDTILDTLLFILERLEILHNWTEEKVSLVPCLLPEKDKDVFEEVWTKNFHYEEFTFRRMFKFDFLSENFFTRFSLYVFTIMTVPHYWRNGMILQSDTEQVLIECTTTEIQFFMRGNGKSKRLARAALDMLENYLSTFNREQLFYQVLIPCSHCLGLACQTPYFFDLALLEQAVATGENFVYCHEIQAVRIGMGSSEKWC